MLFWDMIKHSFKVLKQFGLIRKNNRKWIAEVGEKADVVFKVLRINRATYFDYESDVMELSPVTQELVDGGFLLPIDVKQA